jgi:hypothetical protein
VLTEDGQRWLEERRKTRAEAKPAPRRGTGRRDTVQSDPYADVPPPDEPPSPVVDIGRARKRDQPHDAPDEPDDGPKLWNATELEPAAQPRWLAANRLPRAAVSLLIGDEGIGKSLLWVLVVAHLTRGTAFPGFGIPARNPGHVILVITEDDWSTAVLPRLQVTGADLDMIRVICVDKDGSGTPIFPRDLPLIRNADPKPDLVVVDCWLDTVPASLSVRDAQQARQALHPWREIATSTDAAIWLLAHSNRVGSGSLRDRYGASYVLRQKARMTIYAMEDGDGALLAGPDKTNGAVTTVASRFSIKPILWFEPGLEHDGTVPLMQFDGFSDMKMREHVEEAAAAQAAATASGDTGNAVAWLAAALGAGPRWSTDIQTAAEHDHITRRQLNTAKIKLNVESTREGGTGPWFIRLPQHSGQVPGAQNHAQNPIFQKRDSGDSGEFHNHSSTSQYTTITPERYMETPAKHTDRCDCGAQLTSPASIRYGKCQECRTITSNDDEPPF